ncbi:hypothetical protein [Pyrobaculum aerophilum]|uniref:hypothetical protein n=1 Tax=Pyrobaculum aerophilum TaxID=13773 RepID=UPI0023F51A76|nr:MULTISPECIES: hypothetical protein [Pyrobaculum]MCX8136606.1 hypothetical protein [Pyrobaculum aerophilum]
MLRVERNGPLVKLSFEKGGREAVAVGPLSDLPAVLGLFVAQMAREEFAVEDICQALKEAVEKIKSA